MTPEEPTQPSLAHALFGAAAVFWLAGLAAVSAIFESWSTAVVVVCAVYTGLVTAARARPALELGFDNDLDLRAKLALGLMAVFCGLLVLWGFAIQVGLANVDVLIGWLRS